MLTVQKVHYAWPLQAIFGSKGDKIPVQLGNEIEVHARYAVIHDVQPTTKEVELQADMFCPVCHSTQFVFLEGQDIQCKQCAAYFRVRETSGDPGCVVDCYPVLDGRYLLPLVNGHIPSICMILKECDGGLNHRQWVYRFSPYAGGVNTQVDTSLGKQLYYFTGERYQKVYPDHNEPPEGLYVKEQCLNTFDDDRRWYHRCMPNPGETPVASPKGRDLMHPEFYYQPPLEVE